MTNPIESAERNVQCGDINIIHVYPLRGPEHEMSADCWCEPEHDPECWNVLIHREVH